MTENKTPLFERSVSPLMAAIIILLIAAASTFALNLELNRRWTGQTGCSDCIHQAQLAEQNAMKPPHPAPVKPRRRALPGG
jgi:hypothetical protein